MNLETPLCFNYKIAHTDGAAKNAVLSTPHGKVETPVFMNVATQGAIKGALSSEDLTAVGCQIALANTYHLHIRPGDALIAGQGGLRRFMSWDAPLLTDSGGFQVFSLAALRKITEEGASFASHVDGRKIFLSPENSIIIQSNLGSTIAMAFDECIPNPSPREYTALSCERTTRWLIRCISELKKQNAKETTINPSQALFGINQGSIYKDIRVNHAKQIAELNLEGYAIGGLAVGEPAEVMYSIIEEVTPFLPKEKPTYLMGVGTPENLLECVERGIDFFDCVLPARNGRHGHVYTNAGKLNLNNKQYAEDSSPIAEDCGCPVCRSYSRAYIRHLFKAGEMLAMRLCVLHNLFYYNNLMAEIRRAIREGRFASYKKERMSGYGEICAELRQKDRKDT